VVKLWDVATAKNIATFKGHLKSVLSVAYTPDSKMLASGSEDETVRFWEVRTGENIATLQAGNIVGSVAFSPDGRTLAAGNNNRTLKLWDVPARGER
jgi:WD40 repeat protein